MQSNNSDINFSSLSKSDKYEYVLSAIKGLIETESDLTANLANTSAVLKNVFQWWWVGFYLVKENELVLGPFQGPVACTRIAKGKGVCGTCWETETIQLVPNVHEFPGHIACSADSNSEIVLPIIINNKVAAVLDIDSEHLNHFDEIDAKNLELVCSLLQNNWNN